MKAPPSHVAARAMWDQLMLPNTSYVNAVRADVPLPRVRAPFDTLQHASRPVRSAHHNLLTLHTVRNNEGRA